MPTYEYECRDCSKRVEAFQRITAEPLTTCESCGGSLRRVLFPVGIVFKGSGFYVTDYKNKENAKSGGATNGTNGGSSESKSTEKAEKSETKETTTASTAAKSD